MAAYSRVTPLIRLRKMSSDSAVPSGDTLYPCSLEIIDDVIMTS